MKENPPSHLSAAGKKLWRSLFDNHHLDDPAGMLLLRTLCESFDRAEQARRVLRREGLTTKDRFAQKKAHPMLAVERDAKTAMLAAIRALKLQPEDMP